MTPSTTWTGPATIWAIGKSTDVVRDDADGDLCSTALCERSIRDGHDFDEVTSVAWTQLVVQRFACTACQPISIGSVAGGRASVKAGATDMREVAQNLNSAAMTNAGSLLFFPSDRMIR